METICKKLHFTLVSVVRKNVYHLELVLIERPYASRYELAPNCLQIGKDRVTALCSMFNFIFTLKVNLKSYLSTTINIIYK